MKRKAGGTDRGPAKRAGKGDAIVWKDDLASHVPGSIVRIRMVNFLTYDNCEVFPGARLNVVVGPNGSGKSSIVCAIAIGLGAHPSVLGRSNKEQDYIKHGKDTAEVEVELQGRPGEANTVVLRVVERDAPNRWLLGLAGKKLKKATHDEVVKRTERLNVQINNLCQFLPQDRVSAFALMDERALLVETEKAVGQDEKLHETHQQLIEIQKEHEELTRNADNQRENLEKLKQQNQVLAIDVQRFQEREKYIQQVKACKNKKAWLEYDQKKEEAKRLRDEHLAIKQVITKMDKDLKPMQKEIESLRKQEENNKNELMKTVSTKKSLERDRGRLQTKFDKENGRVEELQAAIEQYHQREENKKKEVEKLRRKITDRANNLSQLITKEEKEERLRAIQEEGKSLSGELSRSERMAQEAKEAFNVKKLESDEIQKELSVLKNERHRRLQYLRSAKKDVFLFYTWLSENQNKFRKEVLGPVCLDISIGDQTHAHYMEHVCPRYVLEAFIVQTREDEEAVQEAAKSQRLKITSIFTGKMRIDTPQRLASREVMERYGASQWLDECFDAPPVIKSVVMAQGDVITKTLCGTAHTKRTMAQLLNDQGMKNVQNICTPDSVYNRRVSRYGGGESTRIDTLRTNGKLFKPVDMEACTELEQRLQVVKDELGGFQQRLSEARGEVARIQSGLNALKRQKNEVTQEFKKRQNLIAYIREQEKALTELANEEGVADLIAKAEVSILKSVGAQVKFARDMVAIDSKVKDCIKEHCENCLSSATFTARRHQLGQKLRRIKERNESLITEERRIANALKKAVEDAKTLKKQAEQCCPRNKEWEAKFAELPDNMEDLELTLQTAQTKVDVNMQTNPVVVQQYEKRKKEIEQLEKQLGNREDVLGGLEKRRDELKNPWLAALKEKMEVISSNFSNYMKQIKCDGKVELRTPGEDFSEYGIAIMVQFRKKGKMQQLRGFAQSGGEKSVSTMLYLISLQGLTPCPFRLVDEINQGMDAKNERMIFEQVVQSACSSAETPQYFLITPKLLPDLRFTPEMTVLCILNGPWQQPFQRFTRQDVALGRAPEQNPAISLASS
mmetsp:Transcript_1166/g.3084  ORF Transcript_1166/g.3084 Transcript_1166/m.3084 type:complete len:1077 (+) Transcript_1166:108-3338(+)